MSNNSDLPNDAAASSGDDVQLLWDELPANAPVSPEMAGLAEPSRVPWRVLAVDDDRDVLELTRFVLGGFCFEGRSVELLFASSRHEAEAILAATGDIAVILLDVVMEEEDAGLRLVRFIREELGNQAVRIILRTGYPGLVPEHKVIFDYDINDYKAKTELTAQRLTMSLTVALRGYRDIVQIEANRRGLVKVLDASSALFGHRMIADFAVEAVHRIDDLLQLGNNGGAILCLGRSMGGGDADYVVLSASGLFAASAGETVSGSVPRDVADIIRNAHRRDAALPSDRYRVSYFDFSPYQVIVSYVQWERPLSELDRNLLEILCGKIAVGLANVHLLERMIGLQKGVVFALAKIADYKGICSGGHPSNLERLVMALVRRLRSKGIFPELEQDDLAGCIGFASILHDIGMVSVKDAILTKKEPLLPDEREEIRLHTTIGRDILNEVALAIEGPSYMQIAAECAENHHEWFDGGGYPAGLAGDAIPLSARIVSVVDVFTALTAPRHHRPAWKSEQAIRYLKEMSGKQFDPNIVGVFLNVLSEANTMAPSDDFTRALLR
ncbi:DUF3369 domain-containing protein [Telmatospirillum siberiense]|uniref:Phosphodiesterase n=1 Tax=Telmatospirillum siberiense TaxID=382514 RepID=A0A2N3PNK9_9PROT|nr:DUF3369 domain-containing protein [Telmatospirillum siberiense]PKU21988.1 phosphodiesterase [Telmatospirillum siberiense]